MERRYPDPAVRVLDPRFNALRLGMASVECLYQGARWSEGPVWFGDSRTLVWSDIPNNRMLRWDEETGEVRTFRKPSNNANGNTRDREGRLVTCEHLTRRVTRTEYDGSITVLADQYAGAADAGDIRKVGGEFDCHFTGPEGAPYTAQLKITSVDGDNINFDIKTFLS